LDCVSNLYFLDERYWLANVEGATEIPRCSNILNPSGLPPSAAPYAYRGSRVHEWTEAYDRGELPDAEWSRLERVGSPLLPYLVAYRRWLGRVQPTFIAIEKPVWGEANGTRYGGTIDRVAKLPDGRVVIIDLKSTTAKKFAVRREHGAQLWAYQNAFNRDNDLKIDAAWILYLSGDGVAQGVKHDLYEGRREFLRRLDLWRSHCDERDEVERWL
jgi:RecB family exonuclease